MLSEDDFQYALESTRVILPPKRQIDTFGSTSFHFLLVTEAMDSVNEVKVRDGRIEADRPQLITPDKMNRLLLEGFGEKAEQYAEYLERRGSNLALLKYGFQIRKMELSEEILHDPAELVLGRLSDRLKERNDPLCTLIHGVEEGWEVSILKFTIDLAQQSMSRNLDDFRDKGRL